MQDRVLLCVKATGSSLGFASRLSTWLTASPPTLSRPAPRFLGLPRAAASVPRSLLSGRVGGSPKGSRRGTNKVRHQAAQGPQTRQGATCADRESPCAQRGPPGFPRALGVWVHAAGWGRSGEPPAVQAGRQTEREKRRGSR